MPIRAGILAWSLVAIAIAGCGSPGSHSSNLVPSTLDASVRRLSMSTTGSFGQRIISINSGGPTIGNFVADTDFSDGTTSEVRGPNVTIDTSAVGAAPEAVYDTYRQSAGSFSYEFDNLIPSGQYTLRLHFAEVFGLGAGQRQFDVSVNYAPVLTNFDIYVAAGNRDNKAVVTDIPVKADASGAVRITFSPGAAKYPLVQGIELYGTPTPVSGVPPATDVLVNCGGPAVGGFSSDAFVSGLSETGTDSAPIDVSGANTAPAAVYSTYRSEPKTVAYRVTGLARYAAYNGYLHFEDPTATATDQRILAASVAGTYVTTSLDIFAAAGHRAHTAVAVPIRGVADSNGTIPILVTAIKGTAIISAFELHESATPSPSPSPSPTPLPTPSPTFNDTQTLFVGNLGSPQIAEYAPPYTGTPTVISSSYGQPGFITFHKGNLFVAWGDDLVALYAPPFTTGPITTLNAGVGIYSPFSVGFNSSDDLFVLDSYTGQVTEYAPPYTGPQTVVGTGLEFAQKMVVTPAGDAIVVNNNGTVVKFSPPYAGGTGTLVTTGVVSASTEMLDPNGHLFIANYGNNTVTEYVEPYTGSPVATISNGIQAPIAMAMNDAGNLFVASAYTAGTVHEYAPPFTGAPIATITNGVGGVRSMVFSNSDDLFMANISTSTVTEYSPPYTGNPKVITTGISTPWLVTLSQ